MVRNWHIENKLLRSIRLFTRKLRIMQNQQRNSTRIYMGKLIA